MAKFLGISEEEASGVLGYAGKRPDELKYLKLLGGK
jgi:hypothetical protein